MELQNKDTEYGQKGNNMISCGLYKVEKPIVGKRGVHLDLKGLPPTPKRLVELLKIIAAARYNVILVEWEDSFPWSVDKRFRSPTAYTIEDVRSFHEAANDLGIEIIPLVQCLGHMETPLSVPGYEHLREVPGDPSVLNPLAAGARELVQKMVDNILDVMPGIRHFHLGGDEAATMGTHPDTREYVERHGKGALYLQHVEPILDHLNAKGIRPILWHDMMINWDSRELKALAGKSDLMVWGYTGNPDTTVHHFNIKYIRRFIEQGITLWGGTAYKGADAHDTDLPNIALRQENALAWMDTVRHFEFIGVIATGWSRFSTHSLQCEPIDSALDSLVNIGVILHDGQVPVGGIAACVAALDELGEGVRFKACKTTIALLAAVRQSAWQEILSLKEELVLSQLDPKRCCPISEKRRLGYLSNIMNTSKETEEKFMEVFAGLVEPVWLEEYLKTRLIPIREEYSKCLIPKSQSKSTATE